MDYDKLEIMVAVWGMDNNDNIWHVNVTKFTIILM